MIRVHQVTIKRDGEFRVFTVRYTVDGQLKAKTYRLMTGGTELERQQARASLAAFISNPDGDY